MEQKREGLLQQEEAEKIQKGACRQEDSGRDFSEIDRKIFDFQELVRCCHALYIWQYDAGCRLLYTDYPDFQDLSPDRFCQEIIAHGKKNKSPLILSETGGMLWIAAFEKDQDELVRAHIIGPAFPFHVSVKQLEEAFNIKEITIRQKKHILKICRQIPVITYSNLTQYAVMLHYCITGERLSNSDIDHLEDKKEGRDSREVIGRAASKPVHNRNHVYMQEQAMLDMIREGNINYQAIVNTGRNIGSGSGVGVTLDNPLMQTKINAITTLTLSVRAAIEGGVSPEFAYPYGDQYLQKIMSCTSITKIANIIHTAFDGFVHAVHDTRMDRIYSLKIRQCMDYIDMHLTTELSLDRLAKTVGYSKYYLTKKFKEETGWALTDYIKTKRIEYAKILLRATDMDIQVISEQLQFCTRNHFSDTFHKMTGTTPAQYRNQVQRT